MFLLILPLFVSAVTIVEKKLHSELCKTNCLSCKNGQFECLQCQEGYFLYTIPADDIRMELKTGARVCVKCPQSEVFGELIQSCNECYINSDKWEFERECKFEYKRHSQATTYVLVERQKLVYHISQADPDNGDEYYIANQCQGCQALCRAPSIFCHPTTYQQQSQDPQYQYISCSDGYYYDGFKRECQQCPQNCAICQATPIISTKTNIIKCNICQAGFTIYVNAAKTLPQPISECIQCPQNCEKCFFGNKDHDFSIDNWLSFEEHYEFVHGTYEEAMHVYQFRDDTDLRCSECVKSPNGSFIPSLDLRMCVSCLNKCEQCSYTTSDPSILDTKNLKLIYPTEFASIITDNSKYYMLCNICQGQNYVRTLKGDNCRQCPVNVLVCYETSISDPSLKSNIPGLPPISLEESDLQVVTVMCAENYDLNSFKSCVDKTPSSLANCRTQSSDTKCQLCQDNFILQTDCIIIIYLVTCVMGCKALISNCRSCIQKAAQIQCQDCEDGFYLNVITNTCDVCSTISNDSCKSCYQYTRNCISRPYFPDDLCRPTIQSKDDIQKVVCYKCSRDIQLFNYKCLTCGPACKTCETVAIIPYCKVCIDSDQRSTTSDGGDCLQCPAYCVGCKDNSDSIYERICYKCQVGYYLDTTLNRCLKCNDSTYCKKRVVINFNVYCGEKERQQGELILPNYLKDETQNAAHIDLLGYVKQEIEQYNKEVVSELEFNLMFMGDSVCLFKKNTHFYIDAHIPSLQKLEINIKAESIVSFYVYSQIILHGFNKVSLKNIRYLSFADYNLNPTPSQQVFGLTLMENKATEVFLENFEAENIRGKEYYESTYYTTPNSKQAIIEKKYIQFVMDLNNVYNLSIKNVQFKSMNYLFDFDQPTQSILFKMKLDPLIILPYFQLTIDDLIFEDVSFEDQILFEIQKYTMTSNLYENTKMQINNLRFKNCYFGKNSGVFAQSTTQVAGQLFINNLRLFKVSFDQSYGLINMDTLMQASITELDIQNVTVQQSTILKMNTVSMTSLSVKETFLKEQGFLFKSQLQAPWVKLIDKIYYGLQMSFSKILMVQNSCQEPNCLFDIFTPENPLQLQIDLKINKISIQLTDTNSFLNKSKLYEADSSLIKMQMLKSVDLINFDSINNPNIPIINIQQSGSIDVQNVKCEGKLKDHTNYCLFISNMVNPAVVFVRNVIFLDLQGIDNSFLAILSYMPQMVLNSKEKITLTEIQATNCTINQKSQIESSVILIISKQLQEIVITDIDFISNTQSTTTSLFNSNPTLIATSPYANITITNCNFKDNSGKGSVMILEADQLFIYKIIMEESNSRVTDPSMKGGALNLQGSSIKINDCNFDGSIGEEGGLMYIGMKDQGNLELSQLNIKNVRASHTGDQSLNGGAIYIVSSAQLNANIHDNLIVNCSTRNSGGFMYIEPADFQVIVNLNNLIVHSAYALQGSLIRIMNKETSQPQKLNILNVKLIQSYSEHIQFLSSIGELSQNEKQLWMHGNAIIQINYGSLYIDQFVYQNGTAEGFIKADGLTEINLSKIQIFNILLFQCPMIHLADNHLKNTFHFNDSSLSLVDIEFENLREITSEEEKKNYSNYFTILKETSIPTRQCLILIENLRTDCQVNIKNMQITNINCPKCQNGLLTFTSVELDSIINPLLWVKEFSCKQSNTGRMGCIVITQFDLIATNSMNPKTGVWRSERLLTEQVKKDIIQMKGLELYKLECEYGCGIGIIQLSALINQIVCYDNLAKDGGCIYFYGDSKHVLQHTMTVDNYSMADNNIADIKVIGTALNDVQKINLERQSFVVVDQGPRNLGIQMNYTLQKRTQISKEFSVLNESISCILGMPFNILNYKTILKAIFMGENFEYYESESGTIKLQLDKVSEINCDLEQSEIQYDKKFGGFDLSQIILYCSKYVQFVSILVSTDDIIIPTYEEKSPYRVNSVSQNYTIQIPLKIYRCPDGYGFKERACYKCKYGTYILNSYNDEETQMDCKNKSIGMKETEGNFILVQAGYQRFFGDQIEECDPLSMIHNCTDEDKNCHLCQESSVEGSYGCYKGYVGPRCSDCDYQGKFYGEKYCRINNICQLCSNISSDSSAIVNIFTLQGIFIIIMVILSLWRAREFANIFVNRQPQIKIKNLMEYPSAFSFASLIIFEVQLLSIIKLSNLGLQDNSVLNFIGMPAIYYKYIQQKTINTELNQELIEEQIYGLQQIYGIQLICILSFFILFYLLKECIRKKMCTKIEEYIPNIKLVTLGNIIYWIILINGPSYFYYTLLSNLSYEAFTLQYSILYPSLPYIGMDIKPLLYIIIVGMIFSFLLLFIIFKISCSNIYMKILIKDNMANLVFKSNWLVTIPKYFYPYILVLIIALIQQNQKSEIQKTQSIFILFIVMAVVYCLFLLYSILIVQSQKYFIFIFYEPLFFVLYIVSVVCLYEYQDLSSWQIISYTTFALFSIKIIIYTGLMIYKYWQVWDQNNGEIVEGNQGEAENARLLQQQQQPVQQAQNNQQQIQAQQIELAPI